MKQTNVMDGQGCDGDCRSCGCGSCGGELFAKLIGGRHKRDHRRFQRRKDRSLMKQVVTQFNWRNL